MTRKLSVLFVLAFFVMSLSSLAIAAKAKIDGQNKPFVSDASALKTLTLPDFDGSSGDASVKQMPTRPTSLGYYMVGEIQVGSTDFDWQSNDRQQRQVVVGTDNKLHTIWINRSVDDVDHKRSIYYSGYEMGVTDPISEWTISPIPGNGGYGSIAVGTGDDRAIAAYHYTKPAEVGHSVVDYRPRLAIGRQGGLFSTTFAMYDYPSSDTIMPKILNCQGIKTSGVPVDTVEGGYIWPSIATDKNGSNQTIAHVLAKESPVQDTTGKASLVYFRTQPNAAYPTTACNTVNFNILIDSVSSNINYDIAASPVSDKVAAVYLHHKQWTGYDLGDNEDIVYKESNDLGATWGSMTYVKNFGATDSIASNGKVYYERGSEVSALYTDDNCLHVLYLTYWADHATHYYLIYPAKIYHWSSCDPGCAVMLMDANGTWGPAAGRPPLGQNLVAKINLTQCTIGATKRLYAVYTMYPDSTAQEGNTYSDRSAVPVLNGECVVQGSTDGTGALWGPVRNVSQTRSDGCTADNCFSEQFTNAAPYTNDSLRIQYLIDKDAGSWIQSAAGGTGNPQGVQTDNPVVIKSYPCYAVDLEAILAVTPEEIRYPFHAVRNATLVQNLAFVNSGNKSANWTSSLVDGGTGWITLPGSGTVTAGCVNSASVNVTFGPRSTEGLYQAKIRFSYDAKTLDVPVDFYVFDSWFLPQNVAIRTAKNKMMVNQAGQAANDVTGASWTYFASPDTDFITDASLIMGNSKDNLSWLIFNDGQGLPTVSNPFGLLYALSNTTYDSTLYAIYRVAYGKGTNRDSTVGFDVRWYAHKHVDSADFYVGHFEIYKGTKDPTGTVTGLDIAFGCDWDVPSDTSSDNTIGTDPARQMIYLQGEYTAFRQQGFGALAAYIEDGETGFAPIVGGFAWGNNQQVYANSGFVVDSVWKYMEATTGYNSAWSDGDSIGDMSIVMVIAKNYSVTPTSRLKFDVVLAAKRANDNLAGLAGLNTAVDQAKNFIKYARCVGCGDANSDGAVDISDVVFLIAHIFSGGAAPGWCNYDKGKGDANGDGAVDISDAVYLIARIFSGGNAPHCVGK